MPTAATGGSSVGTVTVGRGSVVPTGAAGDKLGKEGRLDGNCDAPLFTSGAGLATLLIPPRGLSYKFKTSFKWQNKHLNSFKSIEYYVY